MKMAVVIITNDGCVLDHNRAITSAYRTCIAPTFSPCSTAGNKAAGSTDLMNHLTCVNVSDCSDLSQRFVRVTDTLEHAPVTMPEPTVTVKESECTVTDKSGHTVVSVSKHTVAGVSEHTVALSEDIGDLDSRNTMEQVQPPCSAGSVTKDVSETCSSSWSRESTAEDHFTEQGSDTTSCTCVGRCETDQSTVSSREEEDSSSAVGENLTVRTRPPLILHTNQPKNQATVCDCNIQPVGACEGSSLLHSYRNSSGVSHAVPTRRVSLRLRHGFFAVNMPYMMDSQFETVNRHFLQENITNGQHGGHIHVTDIQQVLSNKRKRKRVEKRTMSSEEERLHDVYTSLTSSARERGIFLQCIPLPLDNNLLSRQCAQLDLVDNVFTELLVMKDGSLMLHMGCRIEPLMICAGGCNQFSALELIHRRVLHTCTEASTVIISGTSYVLPPRSQFLLSNLQDFCDHLYLELAEDGYDLIVLDPPWENKSVKRKKSYDTVHEDGLQDLPIKSLAQPGCLVALWVTNNERLEDYSLHTLFPAWGLSAVARWHWIKVTQTGDLISSMDAGHKKPYEILLMGRFSPSSVIVDERMKELPERNVLISVPCSLHSKKPPLAEVLHPYLPSSPRCLELFARNLWPNWTSWGREALKHQNKVFFEEIQQPS